MGIVRHRSPSAGGGDHPVVRTTGWSLKQAFFNRRNPQRTHEKTPPQAGPLPTIDDLSAAVHRGEAAGRDGPAPREIIDQAERLGRTAMAAKDNMGPAANQLLEWVANHPRTTRLQVLAARILDKTASPHHALAVWQGVATRVPGDAEALRMYLRWTVRLNDFESARAIADMRFVVPPVAYGDIILYARAYDELKIYDKADWAFAEAMRLQPDLEEPVLAYARSLETRGHLDAAIALLDRCSPHVGSRDNIVRARTRLNLDLHYLRSGNTSGVSAHAGNAVLAKILDTIAQRRSQTGTGHHSFVGSILMLNGSLGSGGAERQLTNTAIGLQDAIDSGRTVYGKNIIGPVSICVRSLTSRPGADFFQPVLAARNVATMEYAGLEPYGGKRRHSLVRQIEDQVRFLPSQMVEGTERLTDLIAGLRPDVVHIWQDGSILATALAALLANVPRIVLSVRTVPPIDRPSRMKPQYDVLYPALVRMPGVVLSANSHHAARRYAHWLDLDPALIPVVHNGLKRLPEQGDASAQAMLAGFDAQTAGNDFTVGAVMRFDENKRPFAWLDCAAALLAQSPNARFIMVGDGPLLASARQYAQMLGIGPRVLFAGQSNQVGFWLKSYDALLLLSKFEGLPNVLIEAQFAGIPVVSTPAGGAAETVKQGVTGMILGTGDTIDVREVVEILTLIRSNSHQRKNFAKDATEWVDSQFTVEQMLENTVRVYTQ